MALPPLPLLRRYGAAPDAVERESLARIDRVLAGRAFGSEAERLLARRLVYAAGDPALADLLRCSPGALDAGVRALRGGAPLVCDVRMVEAGISAGPRTALGCAVHCAVAQPEAAELARELGITRTAAGLLLLAGCGRGARAPRMRGVAVEQSNSQGPTCLDGAVVAIGNAPTALLALLDLAAAGYARPALVIGMPVGFVAAAESKELLQASGLEHVTVVGTRGGSALAVATVNLLLSLASSPGTTGAGEDVRCAAPRIRPGTLRIPSDAAMPPEERSQAGEAAAP